MFLSDKNLVKSKLGKFIVILLIICILSSIIPYAAFAEELDEERLLLTEAINKEFSDGEIRSIYKEIESNYTIASWTNYSHAIEEAITIENKIDSTLEDVNNAINILLTEKSNLVPKESVKPEIPLLVKAEGKTINSILTSWKVVNDVDGYEIYRSITSDGTYKLVGRTSATSYVNINVSPDYTYYYKVRSYIIDGSEKVYGEYSDFVSAKSSVEMPLIPPSNVKAIPNSETSIKTLWDVIPGVSGYEIYRSVTSEGTYKLVGVTSATSYVNTNTSPHYTYYYKVRAYKVHGSEKVFGEDSSVVSAKINTIKTLSSPTSFKAEPKTNTSIETSWNVIPGVSGYEIYRSVTSEGTYKLVGVTSATSYVNTNTSPDYTYYYIVRAYKNDGTEKIFGEYSKKVSAKSSSDMPLSQPSNVKVLSTSYNSIKTSWNVIMGASGYEIYRSNTSNGQYKLVGITSATSYNNTNLSTNNEYFYKVRAYKVDGTKKTYSEYSPIANTRPVPAMPLGVKANRVNSSSNKISWNIVTGASGYEIYRATASNGAYSLLKRTITLSFTNTNTSFKGNYYYKVRAYRMVGTQRVYSDWSNVEVVNHVGEEVYKYLTASETNRNSIRDLAYSRNWGRGESNACVLFASEALRRARVELPTNTRSIDQLIPLLNERGWKKNTDYTQLKRGDVCFTTDAYGNKNGRPTHTYIFLSWVTPGNYDYAYIFDNQTKDYDGKNLHIRNVRIKDPILDKDAFSFFMYNR